MVTSWCQAPNLLLACCFILTRLSPWLPGPRELTSCSSQEEAGRGEGQGMTLEVAHIPLHPSPYQSSDKWPHFAVVQSFFWSSLCPAIRHGFYFHKRRELVLGNMWIPRPWLLKVKAVPHLSSFPSPSMVPAPGRAP